MSTAKNGINVMLWPALNFWFPKVGTGEAGEARQAFSREGSPQGFPWTVGSPLGPPGASGAVGSPPQRARKCCDELFLGFFTPLKFLLFGVFDTSQNVYLFGFGPLILYLFLFSGPLLVFVIYYFEHTHTHTNTKLVFVPHSRSMEVYPRASFGQEDFAGRAQPIPKFSMCVPTT